MGYPNFKVHNSSDLALGGFNFHQLFTKKNLQILDFIAENKMHIRDIADETNISPAKVHCAVQLFKKYNLIEEKKKKNRSIIILRKESSLLRKIREMAERAKTFER